MAQVKPSTAIAVRKLKSLAENPDPALAGPLRAFEMFSHRPPGTLAHRVNTDYCEPHIHRGEFAVVDTRQRRLAVGAAFLFQWNNGNLQIHCVRTNDEGVLRTGGGPTYWIDPLMHMTQAEIAALNGGKPVHVRMSDGPVGRRELEKKIIGKVIGVISSAHAPVQP